MGKRALLFLLAAGCCGPDPSPGRRLSAVDRELQDVRDVFARSKATRIRFKGEWPWAVARMPKTVNGTVLLGEGARAKVSMEIATAYGAKTSHEAVCDGTKLWRSPSVEAASFDPGATGLRSELLYILAWYGVGWSFPQGPHPRTIGQGYVVCDLLPQIVDKSPTRAERSDDGLTMISHECPGVAYRVRLSFDPSTRRIKKRELIGERETVWYVETYLDIELNATIPDSEFALPAK